MSERAAFRGARGGRGGGNSRGDGEHRGGGRGGGGRGGRGGGEGRGGGNLGAKDDKPKKENILDLGKYSDKRIIVKFNGGREVTGILKGYDQLMNLVLDEVEETLRDDEGKTTTRPLGLLVARGTLLTSIAPMDGSQEIANPFLGGGEDEE